MPVIEVTELSDPRLADFAHRTDVALKKTGGGIYIAESALVLERALRAGFDLHLVKPVQPELLARVLAESEPGRPYRHANGNGSAG